MANSSGVKTIPFLMYIFYEFFLGMAVTGFGIWFLCQVMIFTNLRNPNHYLLNYQMCWLQVVPCVLIVLGLLQLLAVICGMLGTNTDKTSFLTTKLVLLVILIVAHVILSIYLFIYTNTEHTKTFVKDTIYDGYSNIHFDVNGAHYFGYIERNLQCCGVNSARDYKTWRHELPDSCCTFKSQDLSGVHNKCNFIDREANERHGCASVATVYTKIAGYCVAAVSVLIAFLQSLAFVGALKLRKIFVGEEYIIGNIQNVVNLDSQV